MRIFVYYETIKEPWGGINSFFKAFKNEIKHMLDIQITNNIVKSDILLMGANVSGSKSKINYDEIKAIRNSNCKIIHRLDGAKSLYTGDNKHLSLDMDMYRLSKLADWVVFQSQNSLASFSKLGYCGYNNSIIYNGVNQDIFHLSSERKSWKKGEDLKILAVSWSNNINKGFDLIPLLSMVKGVSFSYIGRWPENIPKENVKVYNAVKQEDLACFYRNNHVFFHGAKNDPCPNVVLEALSSGLPIIYHPSGGTEEIASYYGIPLDKENNIKTLKIAVDSMRENYDFFIKRILKNMYIFSMKYVTSQYIKIFKQILIGNSEIL